jgi:hypothetical protein
MLRQFRQSPGAPAAACLVRTFDVNQHNLGCDALVQRCARFRGETTLRTLPRKTADHPITHRSRPWRPTSRAQGRPVPTLIEWDTDIPPLEVLLEEAMKARDVLAARVAI